MSSNVVPLFGKKEEKQNIIPENASGVILAIKSWAESNGIDVDNDERFVYRLADFMALMQASAAEAKRFA